MVAVSLGLPQDIAKNVLLAEVAPVLGVHGHVRAGQHIQSQHLDIGSKLRGQTQSILILKFRLKSGFYIVGLHVRPQLPGSIEQIRGVHSPGEGQGRFGMGFEKFV